MTPNPDYPARLTVDYPAQWDKLTVGLRLIWIMPIAIVLGLITGSGQTVTNTITVNEAGEVISRVSRSAGGLVGGLFMATALLIVFRKRYPRWWFDFARELTRFSGRVGAYLLLLTDQYPSTVEEQAVHLEIDYPDVPQDLNQWLPLFKWLLAIPHFIILTFLGFGVFFVTIYAWFMILSTGQYPQQLFDFVVGVGRWWLRVAAYAFLLVTDRYPPFSLQ